MTDEMKEFDEFFEGEGEKLEAEPSVVWLISRHENWKGKTLELILLNIGAVKELTPDGKEKTSYINLGYDRIEDRYIVFYLQKPSIQQKLNQFGSGSIKVKISQDGEMEVYVIKKLENLPKIDELYLDFQNIMKKIASQTENRKTYEKVLKAFNIKLDDDDDVDF